MKPIVWKNSDDCFHKSKSIEWGQGAPFNLRYELARDTLIGRTRLLQNESSRSIQSALNKYNLIYNIMWKYNK